MTTSAPYTPATLNRIRQGASALQLGWREERYVRVCRDHGIEPVAAAPVSVVTIERPKVIIVAEVVREPAPYIPPAMPMGGVGPYWDDETGTFCCGPACVTVSSLQQIKIMNRLFGSYRVSDAARLSGAEIADMLGTSPECARQHIFNLSRKIAPTGWCVTGNKGRGGGYQLAPARALSGESAP